MRAPKLFCAALLVVSFSLFSAGQVRADDVSYSYSSGGNTFTFELPVMPTPDSPASGVSFNILNVAFSENGGAPTTGEMDFLSSSGALGGFGLWNPGTGFFFIDAFGVPGGSFATPGTQLYTGPESMPTLLSTGGPFLFQDYSDCDNSLIHCDDPTVGTDPPPSGTLTVTLVPTPTPEPSSLLLLAAGLALGVVTTLLRKN